MVTFTGMSAPASTSLGMSTVTLAVVSTLFVPTTGAVYSHFSARSLLVASAAACGIATAVAVKRRDAAAAPAATVRLMRRLYIGPSLTLVSEPIRGFWGKTKTNMRVLGAKAKWGRSFQRRASISNLLDDAFLVYVLVRFH